MEIKVVTQGKPERPVNIIVEYYCFGSFTYGAVQREFNYMVHATYKPDNFKLDEFEVSFMNDKDFPSKGLLEQANKFLYNDAKKWVPVSIEVDYITGQDLPEIPESMVAYRYRFSDGEENEIFSLAQVLARFLIDQDEEILSPYGIYNLFMLKVGETLPHELSVDITRVL